MADQKTLNYTKECAELLGMHDYHNDNKYFSPSIYFCYPEESKNPGCGYYTMIYNGKSVFDSDWNWIMKIVEAIEKLELGNLDSLITDEHGNLDKHFDCKAGIEIRTNSCNVYIQSTMRLVDNFIEVYGSTTKETVVEAINQFLIWYNNKQ